MWFLIQSHRYLVRNSCVLWVDPTCRSSWTLRSLMVDVKLAIYIGVIVLSCIIRSVIWVASGLGSSTLHVHGCGRPRLLIRNHLPSKFWTHSPLRLSRCDMHLVDYLYLIVAPVDSCFVINLIMRLIPLTRQSPMRLILLRLFIISARHIIRMGPLPIFLMSLRVTFSFRHSKCAMTHGFIEVDILL